MTPDTVQLATAATSIAILSTSIVLYFADRNSKNDDCVNGQAKHQRGSSETSCMSTRRWRQLHMISQSIFQLVVFGGTLSEMASYFVFHNYEMMLSRVVPYLDHMIALPSLSLGALSGTVLVRRLYRRRPVHENIHAAVRLLNLFGIYWVVADKTTQGAVDKFLLQLDHIFWWRLVINAGSCCITFRLWWLMSTMGKA